MTNLCMYYKMMLKDAKKTRQSPMQKAISFGEGALRLVGTGRAIWDAGKTVYSGIQAVAPYAQAAIALM